MQGGCAEREDDCVCRLGLCLRSECVIVFDHWMKFFIHNLNFGKKRG